MQYTVGVENGLIKGCERTSADGMPMLKYKIKYARAPIGNLRFRVK